MGATFAAENVIKRRIDALGITSDFLSALAGIPPSRLSMAFRGMRPIGNEQGLALIALLDKLDALVAQAAPVPVAFKSPSVIRELLQAVEDGSLRISVSQ